MSGSERQQIRIRQRTGTVQPFPGENRLISQRNVIRPKLMVSPADELTQLLNQLTGREVNRSTVAGIGHNPDYAVLNQRATGPSRALIGQPPAMGPQMKRVIRVEQRYKHVDIKQGAHQMPSLSMIFRTCSSVTTSPRDGSTGTPLRMRNRGFLGAEPASPRRAKLEMTRPAVDPERWASSLAACKTSSSISNVVRIA